MEALKCFLLFLCMRKAVGTGRLLEPPSRSSMWRFKHRDPVLYPHRNRIQANYNDMTLNCGGRKVLLENKGRCGVCGDPITSLIRDNEAGGKYGLGIITRNYTAGQAAPVKVEITSHRRGYIEFRLCVWNDVKTPITHECLNRYVLAINSGVLKWKLPISSSLTTRVYEMKVQIPETISCSHCVLQWRYRTGNSWGVENGRGGFGLGQQDEYYGCADIAIHPKIPPSTVAVEKSTPLYSESTSIPYIDSSTANDRAKQLNPGYTVADISLIKESLIAKQLIAMDNGTDQTVYVSSRPITSDKVISEKTNSVSERLSTTVHNHVTQNTTTRRKNLLTQRTSSNPRLNVKDSNSKRKVTKSENTFQDINASFGDISSYLPSMAPEDQFPALAISGEASVNLSHASPTLLFVTLVGLTAIALDFLF